MNISRKKKSSRINWSDRSKKSQWHRSQQKSSQKKLHNNQLLKSSITSTCPRKTVRMIRLSWKSYSTRINRRFLNLRYRSFRSWRQKWKSASKKLKALTQLNSRSSIGIMDRLCHWARKKGKRKSRNTLKCCRHYKKRRDKRNVTSINLWSKNKEKCNSN